MMMVLPRLTETMFPYCLIHLVKVNHGAPFGAWWRFPSSGRPRGPGGSFARRTRWATIYMTSMPPSRLRMDVAMVCKVLEVFVALLKCRTKAMLLDPV